MSVIKNIANKTLKNKLIDLIRLRGPMTVADYMKIVLTNPESGFYMNNDVFGVKGHFTTNPEISQMFGEILGVWILQEWHRFGCLKPFKLIEFGPGRGTLMSDIVRTVKKLENLPANSIQIRLIELSSKLRDLQRQNLAKHEDLIDNIQWQSHIDGLDQNNDGFSAYIAHEYLDALPIHKFVRDPKTGKWRDLLIDYDQNEQLRFCIAKQPSLATRLLVPSDFDGDHIEVCPEAALQLEKVSTRLNASSNGCMLICDYGFEEELVSTKELREDATSTKQSRFNRDTFRAFKDHESWPPLRGPGEADLTADVDFSYLKNHLRDKAVVFGSVDQQNFLLKCGIQARLNVLLEQAEAREKDELTSGADLMLNEMGQRYRFLSFFPKQSAHLFDGDPPAGFHI